MPTLAGCLCALLLSTYWVAKVSKKSDFIVKLLIVASRQVSFPGLVVCIWLVYSFSFCHFATVPAQVYMFFFPWQNHV